MSKKDLFYGDVEGRMEELKQKPIPKEKETRGQELFNHARTCDYYRFNLHSHWFVEVGL